MERLLERFLSPTVLRGLKNSLYLYVGTVVNQAIAFVGFLFIVRLLGPHDYGIYATVGAFVGLFSFATLGGLNKVIVREGSRDPSDMRAVLERTVGIRNLFALIGVLSCVAVALVFPYTWEVKFYIVLFSSSLLYSALSNFLYNIYLTFERMEYISYLNILQSSIFVVLSVMALYLGFGLMALYIIVICSYVLAMLLNYRVSRRFVVFNPTSKLQLDSGILRSAIVFSLISLTVYLYTTADVLMISLLGTSVEVAHYSVPYVIFQQGTIALNMMATAFFPIFVKGLKEPMERRRFLSHSAKMPVLSLVIFVPTFVFAEDIIRVLFGAEYEVSGWILQLLIVLWPIRFSGMPFSNALQATGNEAYLLYMIIPRAVLNVILNYFFYFQWGLLGIVYASLLVVGAGIPITNVISYRILIKDGILV